MLRVSGVAGQSKRLPRSANWKERNAALEEVEEMLRAAGGRIQAPPGDLISALKASARCAATRHTVSS